MHPTATGCNSQRAKPNGGLDHHISRSVTPSGFEVAATLVRFGPKLAKILANVGPKWTSAGRLWRPPRAVPAAHSGGPRFLYLQQHATYTFRRARLQTDAPDIFQTYSIEYPIYLNTSTFVMETPSFHFFGQRTYDSPTSLANGVRIHPFRWPAE